MIGKSGVAAAILVAAVMILVAPRPALAAFAPGPDSFGYTVNPVPFTFEDISTTGTRVLGNEDDGFVEVPIGFPFSFYGTSCRTTIFVMVNGLLSFDNGTTQYRNRSFSGPVAEGGAFRPDVPMIAPLWDDWITIHSDSDAVYYQTLGPPGARRLVVQWHVVQHFFSSPSTVTFQAVLFEGTNAIEFHYLDTDTGDGNAFGASATVGIRDVQGHTNGRWLEWSSNQPVIASMTAIRFNAPPQGQPGPPETLTLEPRTATNTVEETHCVTATVCPVQPGVTIHFSVPTAATTGATPPSGSATTDANGEAQFCYTAFLPGTDAIHAFADTDNDGTQDLSEPFGDATKIWVLPPTTPLCEIIITEGGRITAANFDMATFSGTARSSESGETEGRQQYRDHGPNEPLTMQSINVLSIVCESNTQATIFGQATIDGSGSFFYRIRVQDLDPGSTDTYWIILGNGYDSGQQPLEGGNVQITVRE